MWRRYSSPLEVAPDLPAVAYLLPIVTRTAFQLAPRKDVDPLLAGTQVSVRVDLGVVYQEGLLLLLVMSAVALHVFG